MFEEQITEIFVKVDDFCLTYSRFISQVKKVPSPDGPSTRNRAAGLSDSEIITILIGFHMGTHKTFKQYYNSLIRAHYRYLFPGLVSYHRFLSLREKVSVPFMLFLKHKCMGQCTGLSFIDSTKLRVCENQRIHAHRTFAGLAERGRSSTGWFYGFKLHLIVNERGDLLSFYLSKGNTDDRNWRIIRQMTQDLFGKLFGDKGYISKALFDTLFNDGIQLITKLRKNMKGHIMSLNDRILLRKRALIETINDELKNMCQIEHSRHRSVNGFLFNVMSALAAYSFFAKKPSLNIERVPDNQLSLVPA